MVFPICALLSVLAVLALFAGWLFGLAGAFFRRVSWRMDVTANTVEAWGGGVDPEPAPPAIPPPGARRDE